MVSLGAQLGALLLQRSTLLCIYPFSCRLFACTPCTLDTAVCFNTDKPLETLQVRGVAMNPVDHPMGGGTAGGRPSCSPWGLHAKGKKTRDKHKASNRWILARRSKRSTK